MMARKRTYKTGQRQKIPDIFRLTRKMKATESLERLVLFKPKNGDMKGTLVERRSNRTTRIYEDLLRRWGEIPPRPKADFQSTRNSTHIEHLETRGWILSWFQQEEGPHTSYRRQKNRLYNVRECVIWQIPDELSICLIKLIVNQLIHDSWPPEIPILPHERKTFPNLGPCVNYKPEKRKPNRLRLGFSQSSILLYSIYPVIIVTNQKYRKLLNK